MVPSGRRMQAPLPPFVAVFSAVPSVKTWIQALLGKRSCIIASSPVCVVSAVLDPAFLLLF